MDKNPTLSYPEVLLSSTQVQQMLGLSRTSVWRLTRRGVLAPVHIGANAQGQLPQARWVCRTLTPPQI